MFLGHAFNVFGCCLMNKYPYCTYLISRLMNIYTLLLAIDGKTCIMLIMYLLFIYKIVQPSSRDN